MLTYGMAQQITAIRLELRFRSVVGADGRTSFQMADSLIMPISWIPGMVETAAGALRVAKRTHHPPAQFALTFQGVMVAKTTY
jgi:hypothetical protein